MDLTYNPKLQIYRGLGGVLAVSRRRVDAAGAPGSGDHRAGWSICQVTLGREHV